MTGAVLVVPCCEKGKGGGHLTRCIKLTSDLRAAGREVWLYLLEKTDNVTNLLQSKNFNTSWIINNEQINRPFELIVLDRFQTPCDELARWKKIAPVIGIDEGGPCRDSFDFLVDILIPENFEKPSANITSCGLLDLPKKTKTAQDVKDDKSFKILISFGQEDAAGLAFRAINKLKKKDITGKDITLLRGGLNNSDYQIPDFVKVLDSIPNLADHLCEYDLVITHYGITAYEALYAGTKVLLDHPTSYHKKIAKTAGFTDIKKLNSILNPATSKQQSFANLVNSFSPQVNHSCPVCGKETNSRSIARFPERTYRRCPHCGIIHMDRTCPPHIEYEREYFFESYKKQYGKTYLEDFPNLVTMAKLRLKIICALLSATKERALLDIGCAYGPFLAAAKEEGFSPAGIDPAQDAVSYVQKTLGIHAVQGFFPNCQLPSLDSPPYDVVTLWYVIEHFNDCAAVLASIKKLLKPCGILAFSTPSFSGVSGRKSLRLFLENSPADHYTVWSPKMCKKALAFAGFKVKKIVISGHHPERFPLFGKFAKSKKSPLYWLFFAVSKIFNLGDTFEVYAKLL
jgi:2-polyprenyl-3-methyl-5-hydroxy-6-metoxy-1,4-benzoquinol methylase/spore coat polysaccharide biosynthesis predicted glycosyltransferase SpsG